MPVLFQYFAKKQKLRSNPTQEHGWGWKKKASRLNDMIPILFGPERDEPAHTWLDAGIERVVGKRHLGEAANIREAIYFID